MAKLNEEVVFTVKYKNNLRTPSTAKVVQKVNELSEEVIVLFGAFAEYEKTISYAIDRAPISVVCQGEIVDTVTGGVYDEIQETYDLAVLDDNPKPVSEYPLNIPDAVNSELDLAYNWEGLKMYDYPPDLPTGITVYGLSHEYRNGWLRYEEVHYKEPDILNTIFLTGSIDNNTGFDLTLNSPGTLVTLLYEDRIHVSQLLLGETLSDVDFADGSTRTISDSLAIPEWAYGYVQLCKVVDLYKAGQYWSTLGIVLDAPMGRVVLP